MEINKRIEGQHLRLARLELVAPFWLSIGVPTVTALDLRLLQLPRGGGNHRQGKDKDEGKDR